MSTSYSYKFPADAERWVNLIKLWIGGLAGWLFNPAIWLVFPPRRWLTVLAVTAYAESRFRADETGEDGELGILQFMPETWDSLSGTVPGVWDSYDALNPAYQGFLAARYYQDRILADYNVIWYMLVPYWGFARIRWEWRHSPGSWTGFDTAWTELKEEQAGDVLGAWNAWTWTTLAVFWIPILLCMMPRSKKKKRTKRRK